MTAKDGIERVAFILLCWSSFLTKASNADKHPTFENASFRCYCKWPGLSHWSSLGGCRPTEEGSRIDLFLSQSWSIIPIGTDSPSYFGTWHKRFFAQDLGGFTNLHIFCIFIPCRKTIKNCWCIKTNKSSHTQRIFALGVFVCKSVSFSLSLIKYSTASEQQTYGFLISILTFVHKL